MFQALIQAMSQSVIQRALVLLTLMWVLVPATAQSASGQDSAQTLQQFRNGLQCMQTVDVDCANLALNKIPSQSPYAKILSGNIAAASGDVDSALRLLLPLKSNDSLDNETAASLHASLALAYDQQGDPLRALEERTTVDRLLGQDSQLTQQREQLHTRLWQNLNAQDRATLVTMRGESRDTEMQGWIDLALAKLDQDGNAIKQWPSYYPGHPAAAGFSATLLAQLPADETKAIKPVEANATDSTSQQPGSLGLILPLSVQAYYPAADAIAQGVAAAQTLAKDQRELRLYATDGSPDNILAVYQRAIEDGVQAIIGPLTRDEISALIQQNLAQQNTFAVPTLTLNVVEANAADANGAEVNPPKLLQFGLPLEAEINQIATTAQRLGMQTANIIGGGSPLAQRLAQAFRAAWEAGGGRINLELQLAEPELPADAQARIEARPADMIFLAANSEEARSIRPALSRATPTFATSHAFSGVLHDASDDSLNAVRFLDLPWLLKPERDDFAGLKPAAADLPPGEMQRWFALGVDAYRLLGLWHAGREFGLSGLTGKIQVSAQGEVERELSSAHFSPDGVVLETMP